jgi:hypothetical protein
MAMTAIILKVVPIVASVMPPAAAVAAVVAVAAIAMAKQPDKASSRRLTNLMWVRTANPPPAHKVRPAHPELHAPRVSPEKIVSLEKIANLEGTGARENSGSPDRRVSRANIAKQGRSNLLQHPLMVV